MIDYRGRTVLVTGGTKGIGRAIALAFARRGAHLVITQKWGSVDAGELGAAFAAAGASPPITLDADASRDDDAAAVMEAIAARTGALDVLVSNVAFAPLVPELAAYSRRGLASALDYSAYPVVAYTRACHAQFGAFPRHVLAVSSVGADTYHVNYDIIAAAKAALEALCKYLHHRLRKHGARVNAIRTRFTSTDSLRDTIGPAFEPFVERHAPGLFTTPTEVGEAAFGLCSGLMDGVGGQVITIDRGAQVFDNLSRLFAERAVLPQIGEP